MAPVRTLSTMSALQAPCAKKRPAFAVVGRSGREVLTEHPAANALGLSGTRK